MDNPDKEKDIRIRKIQIYPFIENLHSAYNLIMSNPPQGYRFIGNKKSKKQLLVNKAKSSEILKYLYHLFLKIIETIAFHEFLFSSKKLSDADLIFSINTIYKGDSDWVLHILDNTPHGLAGFNHSLFIKNLKKIDNELSKDNCKKIICANKSSLELMKKYFSKKVSDKLVLINRPVIIRKQLPLKKIKENDKIVCLFVGSLTNPQDFYIRGGLEALMAFEKINKKYPSKLIIKCKIPEELKKRISSNKNILLIEKDISQQEVSNLYNSSDIFLFPAHSYMGSIVEAMSFGLSVVCLNTFAVEDYIKNKKTGILVKRSEEVKEYDEESYPTNLRHERFIENLKKIDNNVIERLYSAVELLIKIPSLRKKLGKNAKNLVIKEHSLENHNNLLKEVFDEIFGI